MYPVLDKFHIRYEFVHQLHVLKFLLLFFSSHGVFVYVSFFPQSLECFLVDGASLFLMLLFENREMV